MLPYQDSTLISLVLACCEDPTHPIEPLSDRIRERNYPYFCRDIWFQSGVISWHGLLRDGGYNIENPPRHFSQLLKQLRDLGTWEQGK